MFPRALCTLTAGLVLPACMNIDATLDSGCADITDTAAGLETDTDSESAYELVTGACPSHWPVDALDGYSIEFWVDAETTIYMYGGPGELVDGAVHYGWRESLYHRAELGGGEYEASERHDRWLLACAYDGLRRMSDAWTVWDYGPSSPSEADTGTHTWEVPPLALPVRIDVDVTWIEEGVRLVDRSTQPVSVAGSKASAETSHTVTSCADHDLAEVGVVEVCFIASEDDEGRTWSWAVAEGIGPVQFEGLARELITLP